MIKKLAILASLAMGSGLVSAATITVIDFGLEGTTTMVGTINQAATSTTVASVSNMVLNTTAGADSNIRFSTNASFSSTGAAGSFSPAGSTDYTVGNAVVDGWIANEQVAYGDIWQGAANSLSEGTTMAMTFTGLAANTDYTFKLLSGRANTYAAGNLQGTYNMTYDSVVLAGGGTKGFDGSAAGLNTADFIWNFSTGASGPTTTTINLSGRWNINALVITAVPEPSAALLCAIGGLALLRRRR